MKPMRAHESSRQGPKSENIEDLIIELASEDSSTLTAFYSGGSMSVHEAWSRLVCLAVFLKIDKHGMQKLLKQLAEFVFQSCDIDGDSIGKHVSHGL